MRFYAGRRTAKGRSRKQAIWRVEDSREAGTIDPSLLPRLNKKEHDVKHLLLLPLLALVLVVTGCSAGDAETNAPQEVVVTATDLAFDTDRLEVTADQPVALTLRNDGALEHDLSIMHIPVEITDTAEEDEAGHDMSAMEEMPELHVSAMPGTSNSLTFTPTEPGEYIFFCTVTGHQDAGMTGTLVVATP